MTIKLLAIYGRAPVGAILSLDAPTETALVAAKQATTDLTGGTSWLDPYTVTPLASGAPTWILTGATAGQSAAWRPFRPGMQLALGLDSGSVVTAWSIDISADGISALGQAWTDTWDKSSSFLLSPPMYLSAAMMGLYLQAVNAGTAKELLYKFNVLGAGPMSVAEFQGA